MEGIAIKLDIKEEKDLKTGAPLWELNYEIVGQNGYYARTYDAPNTWKIKGSDTIELSNAPRNKYVTVIIDEEAFENNIVWEGSLQFPVKELAEKTKKQIIDAFKDWFGTEPRVLGDGVKSFRS